MKKINGWARLGIVLSVVWLALTSFVYFDEIINNPSYFSIDWPLESFNWIKDTEENAKAHAETNLDNRDFPYGYIRVMPTFSLKGYFMMAILPLLVGWLIPLIIWAIHWIKEGFRN